MRLKNHEIKCLIKIEKKSKGGKFKVIKNKSSMKINAYENHYTEI